MKRFFTLLKVRKSQEEFVVSSILQKKKEQKKYPDFVFDTFLETRAEIRSSRSNQISNHLTFMVST